jgi:hypothetical protein
MQAIRYQRGIRAMGFDGPDVGLAHVTTCVLDSGFLIVAQRLVEELVNGLSPLALADPDQTGSIQVVDRRGVLVPLVIGDSINANARPTQRNPLNLSNFPISLYAVTRPSSCAVCS